MNKKIYLTFICFCLSLIFCFNARGADFIVVIDAGHGGKDGGAVRGNYKEKDINLGVALALGNYIESNMKDVKVIYTRKSDVFVNLYKRSDIANKAKANLFISIHTNSTASKFTNASGADTYILGLARNEENLDVAKRENSVITLEEDYSSKYEGFDPNSPESNILFQFMTNKYIDQSLEFATHVQNTFSIVANRVDRGVSQAGFLVLRESAMPSVLIELGFINNPNEAKFLSSKAGQDKMAQAIYQGLKKYKSDFDVRQGAVAPRFKDQENRSEDENDKSSTKTNTENSTSTAKSDKNKNSKNNSNTTITATTKVAATTSDVRYKVQFLISTKKLSSSSFKGVSPVEYYVEKGVYKYTYGSFKTEAEAVKAARSIRSKFKDAFVIKFQKGKRVY